MIRVDCARWGQTPEDLRHLALGAPHARTRERALALFDITQHRCATQVAGCTGRRAHTVMDMDRLPLAGPVDAGLVLRALSLQRGPGAAVALLARQRRA